MVKVLGELLEQHKQLPALRWTTGATGARLVGQVATHDMAEGRAQLDAWVTAMEATPDPEPEGRILQPTRAPRAAGRLVSVVITATLDKPEDDA